MSFYTNFNFLVEIEGLAGDAATVVGGFSQVSGLSSESEVVEHWVGSMPFAAKLPGRTRFGNIVLRKGLTTSADLYDWRRRVEAGEDDRRSGSVILLDGGMREKARWNFYEAWPCRYEAPTFDATDSAVSVETLELAVERLERVSVVPEESVYAAATPVPGLGPNPASPTSNPELGFGVGDSAPGTASPSAGGPKGGGPGSGSSGGATSDH